MDRTGSSSPTRRGLLTYTYQPRVQALSTHAHRISEQGGRCYQNHKDCFKVRRHDGQLRPTMGHRFWYWS